MGDEARGAPPPAERAVPQPIRDRPSAATILTKSGATPPPVSVPSLPPPPRRPAASEVMPTVPPAPRTAAARPSSPTGRGQLPLGKLCPVCGDRFPLDYRVCPRDVVQLERLDEDASDPLLGAMLADTYRVVRLIGQGGMGRVYEAQHLRLGARRFALKVMHAELARKAELVTRFRREAETACVAAHPNVLEVFDIHETEAGVPFIVAELLDGEDLGQRLERQQRLSLAETLPIVRQLCAGLASAHKQGVVHRDLKPDNVFLIGGDAPIVKLLDFGIARITDSTAGNRTRTGVIMGTPAYMAPEQARGAKVDARADIYSVGAILYRCLTGHEPFEAEDPAATLTAVLTREPARPRSLQSDIPEAVELVIERAMAREPHERYQTLGELDAALAQAGGEMALVVPHSGAIAVPTAASSGAVDTADTARAVQRARPTVVALSLVAFVLLVGMLVDLGARVVAATSETGTVGGSEGLLLVLGTCGALATPLYMWIRYVARTVWGNSRRALTLARRMAAVLGNVVIAYLFVVLCAGAAELALSDTPGLVVGLFTAALACFAATVAGLVTARATARAG